LINRFVFALCGIWVWFTRRRRMAVYVEAAKTLELAHASLLREFTSRASTSDRGTLLPHQVEALSLLERHATMTYIAVSRFPNLRWCLTFVAGELGRLNPAPAAAPRRSLRLVPIRIRYRLPRFAEFAGLSRLVRSEASGGVWSARRMEPAEQAAPLKAA
jgi:hypothetical protein